MFNHNLSNSEVLMDETILRDLEAIVDYLWRDEYKSWQEADNDENHIFHAVNNLRNRLIYIKENSNESKVQ